jgi:hypothetical protein
MAKNATVEMTADEKLINKAKQCLEAYQERESDNIRRAEEAIQFRAGWQWPDAIRKDRENPTQSGGPRPCPVLDKTNQYVRQIINEERLNRAAIKYRPVDDDADEKTAEIYSGITRHIEDASEAIEAYTLAGEQAIDGGFGYFRLIADYCDPMSFDQDIRIKRIPNRFSVALGPHTEVDGSDAKEGLVWEDMRREDFKAEYPDAKEVDFEGGEKWADKDTIRVAEYFRIEPEKTTIHMMEDGSIFSDEDLKMLQEENPDLTIEPVDSRETVINKVKWYKVTASEILDSKDLPGSYIPIIKVTGNMMVMPDGKIRLSGAIEEAMDSQRLHNYAHAGFIEHVALAPRAPWVAEEDQVEGYESEYEMANRMPISLLKYKSVSVEGALLPPPQRTPAEGIPMGWQQMLSNTEHGVEASFGMYGPSIGAQSAERSGIALQEQKAQGAVGQFHFPDNLARSIQHCGRILLEWIPIYYDTERVARILGEDGTQELVNLNPNQPAAMMDMQDEMGRVIGKSYNLNVGKYDVTVTTGPSYSSKRQEAVDTQTQIITAAPDLLPIIGDILFDNMETPGSDKIAERMRIAYLPPEIKQAEADDSVDPKVAAAMQQVEQASQMIEQRAMELQQFEQQVQEAASQADNDKTEIDALSKELTAQQKVFDANVKTAKANLELFGKKLIDQLEDITDPLLQELEKQTMEVEIETENGVEKVETENPQMMQLMAEISAMSAQATEQMALTVAEALETLSQVLSQPRETTLMTDEQGNPIGSVSTPYVQ